MKALKCEMCGSNDVVKQDGLYVCQNCGTKYTVEEARKMMIEGTVDVQGTVKVDTSDELKNLYEIARRAKDIDNVENAIKYYDMILIQDPSSWEANFYSVYFKVKSYSKADLSESGKQLTNCLAPVFSLLKENVDNNDSIKSAVSEIYSRCTNLATKISDLIELSISPYIDVKERKNLFWYGNNKRATAEIMYVLGDLLVEKIGSEYGSISAKAWEDGILIHAQLLKHLNSLDYKEIEKDSKKIMGYGEKVKKYNPSYSLPQLKTGGCFVATCIYGSYNCPEVWTLRRFRDNTLDATWYGRAFIKTYYTISPTLVRWFGETSWFRNLWRKLLDKLVASLRNKGVEDTPYIDKY